MRLVKFIVLAALLATVAYAADSPDYHNNRDGVLLKCFTAPGTPSSGNDATYCDSTDKRLHDKNDAGTIGTTIVSSACAANNFVISVSAAGVITCGTIAAFPWSALTGVPANITTLGSFASTGLYVITGAGTSAGRTLATGLTGLSWTNGDGVSGNPSLGGTLGVASGGSGAATFTANTFLTGNGTSAFNAVAITGLVKGNGASAPTAYGGLNCTNQFLRALDANGAGGCQTVSLSADVTGVLPVANGGTSAATFTGNAFLTGNGTSAFNAVPITGLVLGAGASAPGAYGGTSCTNQFPRSLNASGAATCATVSLVNDITGVTVGANGGTGVANTGKTITIGANFTTTGAGATTLAFGGSSNTQTFPSASATLAALDVADQTVSGGANVTSNNIGTVSSGTSTIDCGTRPLQYLTNGGAFTLAAPANDGSCLVDIINNGSAGAVTFSGFTVNASYTGGALDTVNTHRFRLSISRINSVSTYSIVPLQ